MKENKTDARVIKTKQRIEATFLRMLAEMPFEKLTTTLLIKECLISKGTFYAHYLDKYDLVTKRFLLKFTLNILYLLRYTVDRK